MFDVHFWWIAVAFFLFLAPISVQWTFFYGPQALKAMLKHVKINQMEKKPDLHDLIFKK